MSRMALGVALVLALVLAAMLLGAGCQSAALTSGKVYLQHQDWPRAAEQLRREVEENPASWEAWQLLGVAEAQQGHFAEAGRAFDRAIVADSTRAPQIDAKRRKYWVEAYNRGVTALEAEQHDEAVAAFEAAAALDARDADPQRNLGYLYSLLDRADAALDAYRAALTIDPEDEDTAIRVGYLLYNAGRYEEAAAQLARPAARRQDAELLGVLGSAYQMLGRDDEARQVLATAHAIDPGDAQVLLELGGLHWKVKDFVSAAQAYGQVAALRPDDADAHHNLAMALLELDRQAEARAPLERVVELDDTAGDAWYWLGILYAKAGLVRESEDAFARAQALGVE